MQPAYARAALASARGAAQTRSLHALGVRAKRSSAERAALLKAGTARMLTDNLLRFQGDPQIALEASEALAALAEGISDQGASG